MVELLPHARRTREILERQTATIDGRRWPEQLQGSTRSSSSQWVETVKCQHGVHIRASALSTCRIDQTQLFSRRAFNFRSGDSGCLTRLYIRRWVARCWWQAVSWAEQKTHLEGDQGSLNKNTLSTPMLSAANHQRRISTSRFATDSIGVGIGVDTVFAYRD